MKRPWMPLYVSDYLRDTRFLTATEHGAYLLLIMEYWTNGKLPTEDAKLARLACMTPSEWEATKPTIAGFFTSKWRHKRIDDELAKVEQISSKRRASAMQMHSKKDANAPTLHTSQETLEQETAEPKNTTQPQKDIRAVAKATRPANSEFQAFWKAYPKRAGANPKAPALKAFEAFVKGGIDPKRIAAGARICADEDRAKIGTEFIPQAVKWLRDRRWEDYLELAGTAGGERWEGKAGSPEWAAWTSYWTRIGRKFSVVLLSRNAEDGKSFIFPSRWPPDENKPAVNGLDSPQFIKSIEEGVPDFLKRTA